MIVKSVEQKEISNGNFARHLGKRIQYVEIMNEKDCIKVKPKGWLDKEEWKEIKMTSYELTDLHGSLMAEIAAG